MYDEASGIARSCRPPDARSGASLAAAASSASARAVVAPGALNASAAATGSLLVSRINCAPELS